MPGGEDRALLDLALSYADRGWPVFPLAPGKKTPRFRKGHMWGDGHNSATTHKPTIRMMWRDGGYDCNIGIATGHESGLFIIDFDTKGAGAEANEKALLATLGLDEWPWSYLVLTPSGGWHRGYYCPPELLLGSGRGVLARGVDHRGDDGYVVAAGSVVGGRTYEAMVDVDELAEVPAGVVELITSASATAEVSEISTVTVTNNISFSELWAEVGITLRSGNHNYSCPWHGKDIHPSLTINSDTGMWRCFTCDRRGNYRALWKQVRPGQRLPGGEGQLSNEDREVLNRCEALATDITRFRQASDHKGYLAIIRDARKKGSLELGVSGRTLAEEAGFREPTSRRVVIRLVEDGLIEGCEVPDTTSGGYRVLDPLTRDDATKTQSYNSGGEPEGVGFGLGIRGLGTNPLEDGLPISHDALRHPGWGASYKTAIYLQQVGKDTVAGITDALGYRSTTTITRHLKELITSNAVVREGALYRWVTPDQQTLNEYAQLAGVAGKGEDDRLQHQHDREGYTAYQDWLKEKRLISRHKRTQRRVERALAATSIPTRLQELIIVQPGHTVDTKTGEVMEGLEHEEGS